MNSLNQHRRLFSLSATITAIILLGAFVSTFAQAEKEKPKSSLTDEIIGTWSGKKGNDPITFTFNKDNSFSTKEPEGAHQEGTYQVLGVQTIEIKAPNRPTLKLKVQIAGDTMHMIKMDERGEPLELKRVK
jgi:hypothetical protein